MDETENKRQKTGDRKQKTENRKQNAYSTIPENALHNHPERVRFSKAGAPPQLIQN